ncbi:MAG: DEAD/DEAH box helicase [Anaerolineales bacterium]|nr:DEAD/DEAH box helicase [Anaerolineales bacterium]
MIDQTNVTLRAGMIVRIPFDTDDPEATGGDYREFRTGHITDVDYDQRRTTIKFLHIDMGREYTEERLVDIADIERCLLPEDIHVRLKSQKGQHRLLTCTTNVFNNDCLVDYYVQISDTIEVISEVDILFSSHLQAPNPLHQLKSYELHNPVWLTKRNQILESYRALQNATFGIESLVGTRVQLLAHQAEVIAEALSNSRCRYVLADEVGLGKTIEACVILKSLKQREGVNVLIVVPSSLIRQWHNELDNKFWLTFQIIDTPKKVNPQYQDTIISSEVLSESDILQRWVLLQSWELLVIDEAHRARQNNNLYDTLMTLSELANHVLLLSATPIQREAQEYIALLKLLDPVQYDRLDQVVFDSMLNAQQRIREVVAYLARDLTPEYFNADDFRDEIEVIVSELEHDNIFRSLVEAVKTNDDLDKARDAIAYVSTNYRIESQIIRNRRKTLRERDQLILPDRHFSMEYAYKASEYEKRVLQALHGYADLFQTKADCLPLLQNLFLAFASSPDALSVLLNIRQTGSTTDVLCTQTDKIVEYTRIQHYPPEEHSILQELVWLTERWKTETDERLRQLPSDISPDEPHRLAQAVRAIDNIVRLKKKKVVVFSNWHPTIKKLRRILDMRYGSSRIAQFLFDMTAEELQAQVDRFQSEDDCLILLTDESGGEGRNFQIADSIIHIDVPWTPSTIEQRIGRVDRLGREGEVNSIVPFAIDSLEGDLVTLWQDAFRLFSESLSGLEIVLEAVQDRIAHAFLQDSREGLANLRDQMIQKADDLRIAVEEERYYEENTGNQEWSRELRNLLDRYNDGALLGEPILKWASLAGLHHHYNPHTRIARIGRDDFNMKSIKNAKFVNPPNMYAALERSRRRNNQVLIGTFDRQIAVRREDLIFFAPGEPWTDNILQNAILSDRGRSCAIQRMSENIRDPWHGFEYLFTCKVNSRSLFAEGLLPVHLFKAGEFFMISATHKILVSFEGQIMRYSSPEAGIVRADYNRQMGDIHLGKRGGNQPPLHELKSRFTSFQWQEAIDQSFNIAMANLKGDYAELIEEDVETARNILDQRIRGQIASLTWLPEEKRQYREDELVVTKKVNTALLNGMANAEWNLESVCFWMLVPTQ